MGADERWGYVFLSMLQAKVGSSVVSRLGGIPVAEVPKTPPAELREKARLTERALRAFEELQGNFDPEGVRARLDGKGIAVLTLADEGYPSRLRSAPDPPPAIFVGGDFPGTDGLLRMPSVALVGSRKATATGTETARDLGFALGARGVCVVSGLALGVDAAAHEGALAGGGTTAGVLGCGIDVVYPRGNGGLFERVRKGGALMSEYFLGEAPLAWRFPARNRIIAGLCDAVVVVEAPHKSGALITARHALDSGRDVWAVPGPLRAPECRGSNKLLADGAGVIWDVPEFVEAVSREATDGIKTREPGDEAGDGALAATAVVPAELPGPEAAAFRGVGFEPTEADVVAGRSGLGMRELLPALALLELKGYVTRNVGGAYLRRAMP